MSPEHPEITRPEFPIKSIILDTRHHENQERSCIYCGEQMDKLYVPRETWGRRIIVRADEVAAYKCNECDIEELNLDASLEFLQKSLETFVLEKDFRYTQSIRDSLVSGRRAQKQVESLQNRDSP